MAKLNGVTTVDMQDGDITKVSYQGEEYTKVANDFGNARTGDIFFYTDLGGYYEITIREKDFFGVPHPVRFIAESGNDDGYMRECDRHPLYRKSPAAVSPPFAEMITSKVDAVEERVTALEVAKEPTPTFNVGDQVKALRDGEYSIAEAGEYGVIGSFDCGHPGDPFTIEFKRDLNGQYDYFRPQDLELATREAKPIVGDIVVITRNEAGSRNAVGDVGRIVDNIGNDSFSVSVEVPGKPDTPRSNGNFTNQSEMRHATLTEKLDYELAVSDERKKAERAEAQASYDAIFTKAGRKPNEYRKGDVVRYLGNSSNNGRLAEVVRDSDNYGVQITMDRISSERYHSVEIVCFAEDRKDNSKGGR